MSTKPNDLDKHNEETLSKMDFRELEALNQSWCRYLGKVDFTEAEIDLIRLSSRIYIKRREVMRKAAPELAKLYTIILGMRHDIEIFYHKYREPETNQHYIALKKVLEHIKLRSNGELE